MRFTSEEPLEHFKKFVQVWFDPHELIRLSRMHTDKRLNRYFTLTREDVLGLSAEDYFNWFTDRANLYVNVNPVKPDIPDHQRGGKKYATCLRGVFLDLDFKTLDPEDALILIQEIDWNPTAVVQSGNGYHVWYRFEQDQPVAREDLLKRFHAYTQSKTEDMIDDVHDAARMLRVPGSVNAKTEDLKHVRLLSTTPERVNVPQLETFTREAYEATRAAVRHAEDSVAQQQAEQSRELSGRGIDVSTADGWANAHDWARDILIPKGFTLVRTDPEGTRYWRRPGEDASATCGTTDWPESPHVFQLFSTAPQTGLADYRRAGVPITKFNALLSLHYGGDVMLMLTDMLADRDHGPQGVV